ncbi:choice-of-anchor I family protein [Motilimonas pumila]|uniref:Esterase-like activity of phytase family protein n=1 Tax=Motilimonas pumila TaxID=2303987 RepID=A0A418YIN8_9GAMM|nr:choice-of-anchor I family protein [Motilimonas pumila]RJG50479.1 esterase-like activity of phytase family protein [Motilimonas pumila]
MNTTKGIKSILATSIALALFACDSSDDASRSDITPAPEVSLAGEYSLTQALKTVTFSNDKSLDLTLGFGSGAYHAKADAANVFYTISDRGPNIPCDKAGEIIGQADFCKGDSEGKIFPVTDFAPVISKIELVDGAAQVVESITLKDKEGNALTGITNPLASTEKAFSSTGEELAFDANGVDTEALVKLADGTFWLAEEYGPSLLHVAADGTVIERLVTPSVASALADANYTVTPALPEVYSKRKLNRGIESLALSPAEDALYFAMQSPLANPDTESYKASRHVRVMKLGLTAGSVTGIEGEYVYVLDTPHTFANVASGQGDLKDGAVRKQSDVKVSEMIAIDSDKLVVLERISEVTKLYAIDLASGDNIHGKDISTGAVENQESTQTKTLEQVYDLVSVGAKPVQKQLVFNSLTSSHQLPKKVEGLALLDESHLALINDNDFGIDGETTQIQVLPIAEQLKVASQAPQAKLIGRYASNKYDASAAEIVAFDKVKQRIFVVNAQSGAIDVLDASGLTADTQVDNPLTLNNLSKTSTLDVRTDVAAANIGAANSVAVYGDLLAVAIEAGDELGNKRQGKGFAAFYRLNTDGTISFIKAVQAGFLPDMVTFTPDGSAALVANEGEPAGNYEVDPVGSVSYIAITAGVPADTATDISFADFNQGGSRASEVPADFRVYGQSLAGVKSTLAQDVEPEYIAVAADSQTAWVSLQENNGLAVIDLADKKVAKIVSLGVKDYSLATNSLDLNDRDNLPELTGTPTANGKAKINLATWNNVVGMYQPDSIASYSVNGETYVVTANEGDAREYFFDATEAECTAMSGLAWDADDGCLAYLEEYRVEDLVGKVVFAGELASLTGEEALGRVKLSNVSGVNAAGEIETIHSYGARSFSIWNAAGELVFDSGNDFERITAGRVGQYFNVSNDRSVDHKKNDRSSAKGPEPEALAVGEIDGRQYAFVGLERVGGFMIYDITSAQAPQFVSYIVNRDFTKDPTAEAAGDVGPEGMKFVSAADSPTAKPLLIIGNEVSGSTSVYQFD